MNWIDRTIFWVSWDVFIFSKSACRSPGFLKDGFPCSWICYVGAPTFSRMRLMVSFNSVSLSNNCYRSPLSMAHMSNLLKDMERSRALFVMVIAGLWSLSGHPFRIDRLWSLLNRSFLVLSMKSVPPSGHVIYISPYSRFNTTLAETASHFPPHKG